MAPGSIPGQCIFFYPEKHCANVSMIQRVYVLQRGSNRWVESTRAVYYSIFEGDQWFANRRAGRPNPWLSRCPRWRRRLPLSISGWGLERFPSGCLAFELPFSNVNRLALGYIHGWDSGCLYRGSQGRDRLVGNRRRDGNYWSQSDGLSCGYHLAYISSE